MKRAKKYCDKLTKTTQEITFGKWQKRMFFLRITFTVKRFPINKGFRKNDNIAINVEDESATDQAKSAIRLKSYNINIVENTSGLPPVIQVNPGNKNEDNITVKAIMTQCENHSSIIKINNTTQNSSFKFDILLQKLRRLIR